MINSSIDLLKFLFEKSTEICEHSDVERMLRHIYRVITADTERQREREINIPKTLR